MVGDNVLFIFVGCGLTLWVTLWIVEKIAENARLKKEIAEATCDARDWEDQYYRLSKGIEEEPVEYL
jgi:hypothetical protein